MFGGEVPPRFTQRAGGRVADDIFWLKSLGATKFRSHYEEASPASDTKPESETRMFLPLSL